MHNSADEMRNAAGRRRTELGTQVWGVRRSKVLTNSGVVEDD